MSLSVVSVIGMLQKTTKSIIFKTLAFVVTCVAVPFQLLTLVTGSVYVWLDDLATWLEG